MIYVGSEVATWLYINILSSPASLFIVYLWCCEGNYIKDCELLRFYGDGGQIST